MRLQLRLVRAILLHVEAHAAHARVGVKDVKVEGWNKAETACHVQVLVEDHYLNGTFETVSVLKKSGVEGVVYTLHGLTKTGQSLLNKMRAPEDLQVMQEVFAKLGAVPIETATQISDADSVADMKKILQHES